MDSEMIAFAEINFEVIKWLGVVTSQTDWEEYKKKSENPKWTGDWMKPYLDVSKCKRKNNSS